MRAHWMAVCAVLGYLGMADALSAEIPDSERLALEAFFDATGGDGWNYADGEIPWLTSGTSPCQWAGISCNDARTEVQGISLAGLNRNLVGELPQEIGDLGHLVTLQVSNNPKLGGPIPASITTTTLENFFGDNNGFTGGLDWMAGLPRLRKVSLRFNDLTGAIPSGIGALSLLEELELEGNDLSGLLPNQLGTATSLRIVNLTNNKLSGPIPVELGALPSLAVLRLDQNRLTGNVPTALGNLTELTILDLGGNPLIGPIPPNLGNLSNLKQLSLGQAQLEGEIPDTLGNLSKLEILSLGTNRLSGEIPPELGNAAALKEIYLDNSRLQGPVPESFSNLHELTILRLSSNQLQGPLPEGLAGLAKLTSIELGWNALSAGTEALRDFVNARTPGGDFEATQTVPPTEDSIRVARSGPDSVLLQWQPIRYTAHEGGYRVLMSSSSAGPFRPMGETANKTISSLQVGSVPSGVPTFFQLVSFTQAHAANLNPVTSAPSTTQTGGVWQPISEGTIQFLATTLAGVEGEGKVLTLTRLSGARGAAAVNVEARSGSARNRRDFVNRAGLQPIIWSPFDSSPKFISVDLLEDGLPEPTESFQLVLTAAGAGTTIGSDSTATLYIADRKAGGQGGGGGGGGGNEDPVSSGGDDPAVAIDETGTKLVAWAEEVSGARSVFCQAFDPEGNAIDERKLVSDPKAQVDSGSLNVESTGVGSFLITWQHAGAVLGRQVAVKTSTTVVQPPPPPISTGGKTALSRGALTSNPDRREYFIVWQRGRTVRGRLLRPSGAPKGPPIRIDGPELGAVRKAVAAFLGSGGAILVAWEQTRASGDIDIYGRILDSLGRPVTQEFRISSSETAEVAPRVAGGIDNFFIVWRRNPKPAKEPLADIAALSIGGSGEPRGPEIRLNQNRDGYQIEAVVTASPTGDCMALWLTDRSAAPLELKSAKIPGCRTTNALPEISRTRASAALPRALDVALSRHAQGVVVLSLDDTQEGNGEIVAFVPEEE